jgi:hypothetical protein
VGWDVGLPWVTCGSHMTPLLNRFVMLKVMLKVSSSVGAGRGDTPSFVFPKKHNAMIFGTVSKITRTLRSRLIECHKISWALRIRTILPAEFEGGSNLLAR